MMKFLNDVIRFYELNNDYVEYLHGIDSQVYYHKSYRQDIKTYVGIMVSLNGINYFIPLTSAKPRHSKQPLRTRDYLMIYDEVKKSTTESNAIYKDNPNSEHK